MWALDHIADERDVTFLTAATTDPDPEVRESAAETLTRF